MSVALEDQIEQHRAALTGHCQRILGSPFDAEDAVQDTLVRAWRGFDRFDGRATLRSWLFSIATNVCFDMLKGRARRARPVDLGPARSPEEAVGSRPLDGSWIEPTSGGLVESDRDPAEVVVAQETIRLALVAALHHLRPRQRAVLLLCEVLRWTAAEAAELLDTSTASVNSALQRARSTLAAAAAGSERSRPLTRADRRLLARYVEAFERCDVQALTSLIHEDANRSVRRESRQAAESVRSPTRVRRAAPTVAA